MTEKLIPVKGDPRRHLPTPAVPSTMSHDRVPSHETALSAREVLGTIIRSDEVLAHTFRALKSNVDAQPLTKTYSGARRILPDGRLVYYGRAQTDTGVKDMTIVRNGLDPKSDVVVVETQKASFGNFSGRVEVHSDGRSQANSVWALEKATEIFSIK